MIKRVAQRPLTFEALTGRHGATSAVSPPPFRRVFDEHAAFVWRTLRQLGVAPADLEDVCQDVFVTAYRKLPGFEGRSTLRTWIYGICLRVASDHRRRAWVRREQAVADVPVDGVEPSQLEDAARRQARALLDGILSELDEDKRIVFVLYEIEELPMKEIARIVGCPLQTAYSRLHAARRRVLDRAGELGRAEREP
jgi:RNA polymerase sigma-70 factor (ECF subfamily)